MSNQVSIEQFSIPTLDNTFSVVRNKAKIPTLKKIGGIDKLIETEEYLGLEAFETDVISWLGDKNARKIGILPANNFNTTVYGLGLAGISSTRFHLADIGIAGQRVIVSFKRKKLASKYPASEVEKVLPRLVYQAVSSWQEAIIHGGFPLHFGVLARILLSQEYQAIVKKTKFSYETLNVLEPCSSKEFWTQVYFTHFQLANSLKHMGYDYDANQVMLQLEQTLNESTYQQAVIETFNEPDLTKVFNQMSDLYLEREKMEAASIDLVDYLPSEVNPTNQPELTEKPVALNLELIQQTTENEVNECKNHTAIDNLVLSLTGIAKFDKAEMIHDFLSDEAKEDVGASTLKQRKTAMIAWLASVKITEQ